MSRPQLLLLGQISSFYELIMPKDTPLWDLFMANTLLYVETLTDEECEAYSLNIQFYD